MEYERTDDGQIQAAFAQRAGQLLVQYDQWRYQVPTVEQFESTLTIALLQSLLTICKELIERGRPSRGTESLAWFFNRSLDEEPSVFGLTPDCVTQRWPSERPMTYRDIIGYLRNALSHPLLQTSSGLPTTGFTTVPGPSGLIEAYEFTQSPWVNNKGKLYAKYYSDAPGNAPPDKLLSEVKSWSSSNHVCRLSVERVNGKWQAVRDGDNFVPVLRLRITVPQLRVFATSLSDFLSEPVRLYESALNQSLQPIS